MARSARWQLSVLFLGLVCILSSRADAQAGGGPSGAGGAGSGGAGSSGGGGSGPGAAGTGGGSASAPPKPVLTSPPANPNDPFYQYFEDKKRLEEAYGTKIGLNIDLLNQSVLVGPHTEVRWVARYDLGIHQKLWPGAEADMDVRGGWGNGPDVDFHNTVNTNQYAQTYANIFVLHLWVQQKLLDDQLTLRGGKMDVGDFMDVNRFGYYNFVGYSFAHNFAVPLPGNPLAGMFTFTPKQAPWVYFSGAMGNGAQSSYTAGFEELANGRTAPFALGELGFKTRFFGLDGVYRFEGWYDGRVLKSIDGSRVDGEREGGAISFDQNLTEKFGVFVRWGSSNQQDFTPQQYWSAGFDWFGPIPSRPRDDFAIGVVQNIFSSQRKKVVGNAADHETYLECYYNAYITQWLQIQPIAQVVANPGGVNASSEFILGVHVMFRF